MPSDSPAVFVVLVEPASSLADARSHRRPYLPLPVRVMGRNLKACYATQLNRWATSWRYLLLVAHWAGSGYL